MEEAVAMEEVVDEEDWKVVDVAGINQENAGLNKQLKEVSNSGTEQKKMKKQRRSSIQRKRKRQEPCGASLYDDIASLMKHELILGHLELKKKIKVLEGSNKVQNQHLALLKDDAQFQMNNAEFLRNWIRALEQDMMKSQEKIDMLEKEVLMLQMYEVQLKLDLHHMQVEKEAEKKKF